MVSIIYIQSVHTVCICTMLHIHKYMYDNLIINNATEYNDDDVDDNNGDNKESNRDHYKELKCLHLSCLNSFKILLLFLHTHHTT